MIVEDVFRICQTTQYVVVYMGVKVLYEGNVLSIPLNLMPTHVKAIYSKMFIGGKSTYIVIEV